MLTIRPPGPGRFGDDTVGSRVGLTEQVSSEVGLEGK